ncbi:carbonic anhydrase [Stenomitos frigidus]|uniref:carbonic anhydrase n=1 Tax=Stenomitos frigidus ULC18 TaxID=2107698 RepID=A0A2T1E3Z4_9CYAN|nr:carbonic anhydrase [Stenomitos frigidus]PSB27492.1 carbonic anhydrase [Stenomitos frigidus ULC18]
MDQTIAAAAAVLQMLMDGNQRYVDKRSTHPHQDAARIHEIALGQHPVAIILGCSDSRVPPEVIFDHGLGDLFVVRVAGNVVDDVVLGSIEYAIVSFDIPLVMVLGHERCGAVSAAVKHSQVPGHVSTLMLAIQPALERVKEGGNNPIDAAVIANVEMTVEEIKTSEPLLAKLVKQGRVQVVGARYDLEQGRVEMVV